MTTRNHPGTVIVLRAQALRGDDGHGSALSGSSSPLDLGCSRQAVGQQDRSDVPIAAAQHCCGRGCKHCQIYWRRMKL
jgi:hypothetical protein